MAASGGMVLVGAGTAPLLGPLVGGGFPRRLARRWPPPAGCLVGAGTAPLLGAAGRRRFWTKENPGLCSSGLSLSSREFVRISLRRREFRPAAAAWGR